MIPLNLFLTGCRKRAVGLLVKLIRHVVFKGNKKVTFNSNFHATKNSCTFQHAFPILVDFLLYATLSSLYVVVIIAL